MIRTCVLFPAMALAVTSTSAFAAGKSPDNAAALTTTTYTQDFNTLGASGESNALPAGFQIVETDNGGRADGFYNSGTGTSNTGDTYSFGAAGSAERALGSLASGTNDEIYFGAVFQNQLSSAITDLSFGYTGEQWRAGNSPDDTLTFQFSTDATALDNGTWLDIASLSFNPIVFSGNTALNGNAVTTAIAGVIDNLTIAQGSYFGFRWQDLNGSGNDHGLAVDNLSFTATLSQDPGAVPEPSAWALMLLGFGAVGAMARRRNSTALQTRIA